MASKPSKPQYEPEDYTVGWLCAIAESELTAARKMLDHDHTPPINRNPFDDNIYQFGEINHHNVVIACMPPGLPGLVSAQKLVAPLQKSFPRLAIHLFVGIAGGIPRNTLSNDPLQDIRLGDVVVGWPDRTGARAVIQYHHVRQEDGDESSQLGLLEKPSRRLLNALNPMISDREMGETKFHHNLGMLDNLAKFQYPGTEQDFLFEANYRHIRNSTACTECDQTRLIQRLTRPTTVPQFHQGTILSGDTIMHSASIRTALGEKYPNAKCIEMEAAGVIDDTHCLVIRGISDYSDGHKPPSWEYYAAGTAAAFAREILLTIRPAQVETIKTENGVKNDEIVKTEETGETEDNKNTGNESANDSMQSP